MLTFFFLLDNCGGANDSIVDLLIVRRFLPEDFDEYDAGRDTGPCIASWVLLFVFLFGGGGGTSSEFVIAMSLSSSSSEDA